MEEQALLTRVRERMYDMVDEQTEGLHLQPGDEVIVNFTVKIAKED